MAAVKRAEGSAFKIEYGELQEAINLRLKEIMLEQAGVIPECLYEAMKYSLLAGGKRLRPILLLEACKLSGIKQQRCMRTACAIEMIHTYSLIHDDLPAMDDDDFRRGRPTCHKAYGEAIAILTGDALLNMAMEQSLLEAEENAEKCMAYLKAIHLLFDYAGAKGMIGGQALDMQAENKELSLEELSRVHHNKTVKLLTAPLIMGGIIGGASQEMLEDLEKFGNCLGFAFQIQDDILDETGDLKQMGKSPKSDCKKGKKTYVSIEGLERAKQRAAQLTEEGKACIARYSGSDFLLSLADFFIDRNN